MSLTPFIPLILTLGTGGLARVKEIRATDIAYELVEIIPDSDPVAYRVTRPAQSAAPVAGFDLATAEAWPTDAELIAALAGPSEADILAARKAQLRTIAKARRATLIADGFSYLGKAIQTRDLVDVSNVEAAALKATNDAGYSTYWITGDNSLLSLDAAGIIGMQSAMVDAGNAIFAAYIATTAAIEAAADLAAVEALAETAANFTP